MDTNSQAGEQQQQISLFELLQSVGRIDMRFSSDEIGKTIDKLREAEHFARKREKEEQRQKEREIREQKEREEKERHDAHVREVTCMDLPLDWNNLFDNDIRVQGVHADSIPDALILCLNTLGKVDIEYISSTLGKGNKNHFMMKDITIIHGWASAHTRRSIGLLMISVG